MCILMMRVLGLILNGLDNEKSQGKKKGRKERDDIPWQNDRRKPRQLEPPLPFKFGFWATGWRLTRKSDYREFCREPTHRDAAGWNLG